MGDVQDRLPESNDEWRERERLQRMAISMQTFTVATLANGDIAMRRHPQANQDDAVDVAALETPLGSDAHVEDIEAEDDDDDEEEHIVLPQGALQFMRYAREPMRDAAGRALSFDEVMDAYWHLHVRDVANRVDQHVGHNRDDGDDGGDGEDDMPALEFVPC